MINKLSISDMPKDYFKGKTVLLRVDFNVPFKNGVVTDDTRIKASIPTIKFLLEAQAKIILVSHLGRPKGYDSNLSLEFLIGVIKSYLDRNCEVKFIKDFLASDTKDIIAKMPQSSICLLENIRFYPEEEKNDSDFAHKLAQLADVYVNDAFGTAHRAHASTCGVTQKLKSAFAGHLLSKELDALDSCLKNPQRPLAVIVGGSKVSTKIGLLNNLVDKVDLLVIGGAMAFTFLKAQGFETGKSLVEDEYLQYCRDLMAKAQSNNVKIILPTDIVAADSIDQPTKIENIAINAIPTNLMGLDVGLKSIETIKQELSKCQTIFWNGPLGVFEVEPFSHGTYKIVELLIDLTSKGIKTVIGGGDSVAALKAKKIDFDKFTHVATGGGASLEYLENKPLPGIECLNSKDVLV